MDDFHKLTPNDDEISEREKRQRDFFNKYSNCGDDEDEGMEIDDLIQCFEALADSDDENAEFGENFEEFEEASESDDCDESDMEGAIGFSNKESNVGNEDKQLVVYTSSDNLYKILEKNYGADYIQKAKNAFIKRSAELDKLNLMFWKRTKMTEEFNENNITTPSFHASSKNFVRSMEHECAGSSKALSPVNLFKAPDPVNMHRNNFSFNGLPGFQGSFNLGSGDSTLPLELRELINQSNRRINLKIREMHYDLSVDASNITQFYQPNQTNSLLSNLQAIANASSAYNHPISNQMKQIESGQTNMIKYDQLKEKPGKDESVSKISESVRTSQKSNNTEPTSKYEQRPEKAQSKEIEKGQRNKRDQLKKISEKDEKLSRISESDEAPQKSNNTEPSSKYEKHPEKAQSKEIEKGQRNKRDQLKKISEKDEKLSKDFESVKARQKSSDTEPSSKYERPEKAQSKEIDKGHGNKRDQLKKISEKDEKLNKDSESVKAPQKSSDTESTSKYEQRPEKAQSKEIEKDQRNKRDQPKKISEKDEKLNKVSESVKAPQKLSNTESTSKYEQRPEKAQSKEIEKDQRNKRDQPKKVYEKDEKLNKVSESVKAPQKSSDTESTSKYEQRPEKAQSKEIEKGYRNKYKQSKTKSEKDEKLNKASESNKISQKSTNVQPMTKLEEHPEKAQSKEIDKGHGNKRDQLKKISERDEKLSKVSESVKAPQKSSNTVSTLKYEQGPEKAQSKENKKGQRNKHEQHKKKSEKNETLSKMPESGNMPQRSNTVEPSRKNMEVEKVIKNKDTSNKNNIDDKALKVQNVITKMLYSDCVKLPAAAAPTIQLSNDTTVHKKQSNQNKKRNKKKRKRIIEVSFDNSSDENSILERSTKQSGDSKNDKKKFSETKQKVSAKCKNEDNQKASQMRIELESSIDDIESFRTAMNKSQVETKKSESKNAGLTFKIISDPEDSDDVIDDEEVFRNAFKRHYAQQNK